MRNPVMKTMHHYASVILSALTLTLLLADAAAAKPMDTLELAIQPILSEAKTRQAFQPLADYLGKMTGKHVVIKTMPNFLAYWSSIRKPNKYGMVLDAAHFTDYRAQKQGYKVLAKIPDYVSYSLVVREDLFVFEPSELIGKRIASLGAPSIGAARLSAMFPNPMRQPIIIETPSAKAGMDMLIEGKVHAAIMPTPVVSQYMAEAAPISVVVTTEPIPHIAFSATSNLDPKLRDKIRRALLEAHNTKAGQSMLKGIGFQKFDPANAKIYAGHNFILKKYWGY